MDPLKTPPPAETKLHFLDYWRIIRIRKTVILAVFLLVVITATLVTFILPEYYQSTARIKIERDQSDIQFADTRAFGGYDPYFIQTEFEVIQSEKVLKPVVETLGLDKDWGKKFYGGETLKLSEAMNLLKGRMDLRPVRNTSLIEIRVLSEKPEEARKIADAIAKAYKDYRQKERQSLSEGGIEVLIQKLKDHEATIENQQRTVEVLRAQFKIPDAMAAENAPSPTLSADTVRKIEGLRIEYQTRLFPEETLLKKLEKIRESDPTNGLATLAQVIPTASQDTLLVDYLSQLNLAQQQLIALQKDLGTNHPSVLKVNSQIEDLRGKVFDRVNGFMLGLESRVDSSRAALMQLTEEVETAKTNDIQQAKDTQPYWEAKGKLDQLKRFRAVLITKIEQEKIEVALPKSTMVEIIDPANLGMRPVRPNKPLNIALGIIIGLVVGIGLAFFIEYLDTSVKTIDDVERTLQSPVLGVIPQNVALLIEEGAESPHAEAYRVLRTNILFSRKDDKLNTIAVVSAGAGEGKSTTVFNLAAVFAQSGQRTVMVDSDLRRPTLHKMLGITNNIGLTNFLLKQNTLEETIQTTSLPSLDFMASGKLPSSSLGILSSAQMKNLISELKQRYDVVLFDSPPIMGVSDASILASEVDMTLQVIQYRRYPQPMNIRAKQLIEKVGGNLVGIVLNNINMSQDESYYYYSGYYHDYYSRNEDQEPVATGSGNGGAAGTSNKPRLDIKQKY
jgi:capsular exopolysaccharide synthesis family protein